MESIGGETANEIAMRDGEEEETSGGGVRREVARWYRVGGTGAIINLCPKCFINERIWLLAAERMNEWTYERTSDPEYRREVKK